MPATLKEPGVYIEEDASLALSVSNSATAVPVFIGKFTPKKGSPAQVCTRISNWLEFTSAFSLAPTTEIVIKSEAKIALDAEKKTGNLVDNSESPQLKAASAEISSDTELTPVVEENTRNQGSGKSATSDETQKKPTWTYTIEQVNLSPAVQALQLYFQNGGGACYIYSLNQAENESTKNELALAAIPELIEQKGDITLLVCPEVEEAYKAKVYKAVLPLLDNKKVGYFLIADSNDGTPVAAVGKSAKAATYYPQLETNLKFSTLPKDEDIRISGYEDKSGKDKLTDLKQLREKDQALAQVIDTRLRLEQQQLRSLTLPPSAAIAGIYCQTDSSRGVWKAPANVALTGVKSLTDKVDDKRQGDMNDKGVNVIRSFTDRGFMVWGARTCVGADDTKWRYIPVRRLFNSVERDIRQALRAVLFEPNNQPTWMRAKAAVDQYLYSLWQKNALMGNSPEEAYFVQIGQGITMSETDIKQGKMIMKVGLAAVRPAEFIVLQFTQDIAQ
ncbi:phage tail sheath family protein [Xenorhabdus bovienii]|uniref:phage tail sheath family protein n=1 Tax=Xenorhabdus bovienii TaxID=40576 RepID=UPI0023B26E9C|nr:phage tail sheath C-terminal domain-containing protein [Xenorhabdus bovienii]MDE9430778.1 phage tail sheath subtilisin-like domain-containing protein [Xenorhabdus bovienii]MDE9488421.1 phage tail sheath subtilisin-like domain-containing protein [Xenorhabdus bovienii]MDE9504800.1 phage tail sheath subtilisin-like domain-containing protein [Xenorhabdus bovienii]MDE9546292.1 phage tail sheath subtilisin-like domain-containing protein [Xenorhabdus bovienii]